MYRKYDRCHNYASSITMHQLVCTKSDGFLTRSTTAAKESRYKIKKWVELLACDLASLLRPYIHKMLMRIEVRRDVSKVTDLQKLAMELAGFMLI